ncbi:MAG: OmpA family protein [Methylocystis sp.]|nr:OmpA family protein [Methylocystis sp.]
MTYFLAHYGIWLAAAFAVGILTGMLSRPLEGRIYFIFTVYFLIFIAFVEVMSGRLALYSESAAAIFVAFLMGEALGAACSGAVSRDHKGWVVGLTAAMLIWLVSNVNAGKNLEADLKNQVGSVVERSGGDPWNFDVMGRDVILPADVADRPALARTIRHVAGVRFILEADKLTGPAAELRDRSLAAAAAQRAMSQKAMSGQRIAWKAPIDRANEPAAESVAKTAQAAAAPKDKLATGRSVTAMAGAKNGRIAAIAAPVMPTAADAGACLTALSGMAALEQIHFGFGSASIGSPAVKALDKLAGALKGCPNAKVEVGGYTDSVGADGRNQELSRRRAQAVADTLGRKGVERARLIVTGYGAGKPIASNDTEVSRAQNRRVELLVK